jgi:hypothetical protein
MSVFQRLPVMIDTQVLLNAGLTGNWIIDYCFVRLNTIVKQNLYLFYIDEGILGFF